MPMHNWKPVRVKRYHHFHQQWCCKLCDALNEGALPKGYFALVEQREPPYEPDVLALERNGRPYNRHEHNGGLALAESPPKVRVVSRQDDAALYARGANRLGIRNDEGELVSIIEIVSPGNKHSEQSVEDFVKKTSDFITNGIHVLVVDPFPPTKRDPHGIHKVIWDRFQEEPFRLRPAQPLTVASYMARGTRTAYVENFAVGDPIPAMPLFLDSDHYVPTPLEESYQLTWSKCPKEFRAMVEEVQRKPARKKATKQGNGKR
jgi:hypothetical protein